MTVVDVFAPSPNLALDTLVNQRRRAGQSLLHLGFGESGLPVPDFLADRLRAGAHRNAYGEIGGAPDVRAAAAGYFTRRGVPTDPGQVLLAPGSKPILFALLAALPGAVVLPRPCWVTYAPQARLLGREVISVPVPAASGGVPDPDLLPAALAAARAAGVRPASMVLTMPDNPTGTYPPADVVARLVEIAEAEDLVIISDEIYRDVVHDPAADITSPMRLAPHRTVTTSGLSKSVALGGWRIGFAHFPGTPFGYELRSRVISVASEVWSTMAGPMQEVAAYALSEPADLVAHRRASTRLHAVVAAAVYDIMVSTGAECRPPTGGFYVYPDFGPMWKRLATQGIHDSADLERHLLDRLGVAVLGGHHFGDDPAALRFRAATSLLYGDTDEERWAAVASQDPLSLPHIRTRLATVEDAFYTLTGLETGLR